MFACLIGTAYNVFLKKKKGVNAVPFLKKTVRWLLGFSIIENSKIGPYLGRLIDVQLVS